MGCTPSRKGAVQGDGDMASGGKGSGQEGVVLPEQPNSSGGGEPATRKSSDRAATSTGSSGEKPTWANQILSSGADKDIFSGTYKGLPVAVCVAKSHRGGYRRIQNEVKVFKTLGSHPHIIEMYCSGTDKGTLYFALEIVEPIGYDLDRMKNMYSFARQTVPSSLMARIHRQLASALGHMHKKGLIHRDLKTENVLVDAKHNAKLIDMGIACKIGQKDLLRSGYLAPELCEGKQPLGIGVDSWGLGIILHQIYQNQWKLLTESGPVEMLQGKPSFTRPMEKPVREAMLGLLQFSPNDRWTLKQLLESQWLREVPATGEEGQDWQRPTATLKESERQYLRRYVSSRPLPSALSVFITQKNHAHLIGHPINSLGLASGLGITVLLISYGKSAFENRPGADTPIKANSWVYFGVPQGEGELTKAVTGLEQILHSKEDRTRSSTASSPKDFRALNKHEVVDTGKLVEFTVEFDCFSFPAHIGSEAMVGAAKKGSAESGIRELNLRKNFDINLVGIQRIGEDEPEWFPRASAIVRPDDLGLVLRQPSLDGSTQPTVTDADLEKFMDEKRFWKCMEASQETPERR